MGMRDKPFKRHCDTCGKYYEGKGRKYCSKKCYGAAPISESTRKKLREKRKGRRPGLGNRGRKQSKETKEKISITKRGKLNPNYGRRGSKSFHWKGGISSITSNIRSSATYVSWRQKVLIRDNFNCRICGSNKSGLKAHHKKSFSKLIKEVKKYLPLINLYDAAMLYTPLWDINNGITYCNKCHDDIHKRKRRRNAKNKN